jgi:hypothetical protein
MDIALGIIHRFEFMQAQLFGNEIFLSLGISDEVNLLDQNL